MTQSAPHTNGHTPPQLPLAEVATRIRNRIEAFLDEEPPDEVLQSVQRRTQASLEIILEALRRYPHPSLAFSYNGGKDCLVLLILYLCALAQHQASSATIASSEAQPQTNGNISFSQPKAPPTAIPAVYIVSAHPFHEVDAFVDASARDYALDVVRLSGYHRSMREAFAAYLAPRPEVKAILVGTRRTDPHGAKLSGFNMTDGGWPPFMRVHPVLEWRYRDIWAFIRHLGIPYCELYDQGYTSLGGTLDTHPNPALQMNDGIHGKRFRPAFELDDDDEERLGRDK